MPVNKNTTVEEVEEYFAKFAESFKSQVKESESPKLDENDDIELE